MLASITPLGERGRSSKWPVTVGFFIAGSTLSAAAFGALAGAIGSVTWPGASGGGHARLAVLAAVLALAIAVDLGVAGLRLPSVRRQVNEDWMREYRGWVYGLGFGLELGLGVVTIVTSAAVYATFVAAWLTGEPALGALVGGAFGLVRGAGVLPGARVRTSAQLVSLHRWIDAWRRRARTAGIWAEAALLVAVAVIVGAG